MLLREIFDPGDMTDQLRQAALDYLTPFLAQRLPFITIDQMIEALRHSQLGVVVDRAMIMDLLNPDEVEAVDRIEGDRIFLVDPNAEAPNVDAGDAEQQGKEHVGDMAQGQAKKSLAEPTPALK